MAEDRRLHEEEGATAEDLDRQEQKSQVVVSIRSRSLLLLLSCGES